MSLIKIQRHVLPMKNKLPVMLSDQHMDAFATFYNLRRIPSESLIQQKNWKILEKNGPDVIHSDIHKLCQSFHLNLPIKYDLKSTNEMEVKIGNKKCKNCENIRNGIKRFLQAKFELIKPDDTKTKDVKTDAEPCQKVLPPPNVVRMSISEINSHDSHHAEAEAIHPSTVSNAIKCFDCVVPVREAPTRGPPIISPVCKISDKNENEMKLAPRGEGFKNLPEKKVIKIDRPNSLRSRREEIWKNQNQDSIRETSISDSTKHQR